MSLLLLADPSEPKVRSYISQSKCFAAKSGKQIMGVCAILPLEDSIYELMNIAVSPEHQSKGIGSKLLSHAIETTRAQGAKKLIVGTGTFGYQLIFYQRAGFRVTSIDRDFFLANYDEPIFEHGIQHKDMLRLEIEFKRLPRYQNAGETGQ